MNRLALVLAAILASHPLFGCSGEETTAPDGPTAPTDLLAGLDLPRVGTIGILPAAPNRVVLNVDADGRITVDGEGVALPDLPTLLRPRADADREEREPHVSRLFVVLRLDRTLPWGVAQWLMQTCAEPGVFVDRIHFAVLPEQGDEEGSLATHLPRDRGLPLRSGGARETVRLEAEVLAEGPGSDPRALFVRAREILAKVPTTPCQVRAGSRVSVDSVLSVVDVLHRAGARAVTFSGTPPPAGAGAIEDLIRRARIVTRPPSIRIFGEFVGRESAPLPSVARIRGAFAGTIRVRHEQGVPIPPIEDEIAELEEEPIEDPTLEAAPPFVPPEDPGEIWPDRESAVIRDQPVAPSPRTGEFISPEPALPDPNQGEPVPADRPTPSPGSRGPVDLALEWLAIHQSADGRWDGDGFVAQCKLNHCGGAGYSSFDPGCTGLALLAFLEAGHTHKEGAYRETVKKALRYLKSIQSPEGVFGSEESGRFTYNQAIATLALARAYALTGSPLFKQSAQRGVDFIEKCRNPYLAWRYGRRPGDNGTALTAWMVMALGAANETRDLRIPKAAFEGAKNWLEKVTEPEYGKVGYTARGTGPARPRGRLDSFPPDKSEACTAMGIWCRMLLGEDPQTSEMIRKGTELCLKLLPEWSVEQGSIDMVYWFFGTRALSRVGGEPWAAWSTALKGAVVDQQRKDGDERGSWDPVGAWGPESGRVVATALMTLCLQDRARQPAGR